MLNISIFVNMVKNMNDLVNPKDRSSLTPKDEQISQFSEKGLYVREDDQDWGSSGMNNIQTNSE